MPVGYLLTVLIVGAFTAVALWPPPRPRLVAQAAYLLGMVVNEVPHLAAGLPLAAATVLALTDGDLGRDVVSLALMTGAGIVVLGLGVVAARGVRSRSAVAAGLREGGVAVPETTTGWAWRTAVTPIPVRPRRVSRIANLQYGGHRRQRLDIYHRRDLPTGRPVLVYFHGGGYYSGGKHREGRPLIHRLAAQGWVCVSASYRLRPHAGFEEHLADASAALAWARDHAEEYGGDARTLVMAGSSAGAHLTSLLALDPDEQVSAAICLYGYYGRYYGRSPAEPIASTPFALAAADAPPFLIAHGDHDTWVPAEAARTLTAKLREESSALVVGIELTGGQHGFDLLRSWRFSAVLAGIEAFLSDARVDADPTDDRGAGTTHRRT